MTAKREGLPQAAFILDIHQQAMLRQRFPALGKAEDLRLAFWGGCAAAERKLPLVFPAWLPFTSGEEDALADWEDYWGEDPLTYLRLYFERADGPGHRDILGATLGLGIDRSRLGDIFFHEEGCDLVVLGEVAAVILRELERAGRTPVKAKLLASRRELRAQAPVLDCRKLSLASLRLDNVLAAAWHLNREKAQALIGEGQVSVDGLTVVKPAAVLAEGQIIRCRGLGKARLGRQTGRSRKGRLQAELFLYM